MSWFADWLDHHGLTCMACGADTSTAGVTLERVHLCPPCHRSGRRPAEPAEQLDLFEAAS